MQAKKINISIVIVNYKSRKEILRCINFIQNSKGNLIYEIIIIDNEQDAILNTIIKKKFPEVVYVSTSDNMGYSGGNNLGVQYVNGEYIFFLNPDTEVSSNTLLVLHNYLKKNKKTGIVAPLLTDTKGKVYQQGSRKLGIKEGIFSLSFFNRLFPNNPISRNYFLRNWDKKTIVEVDVVPGTAFMIKRNLFNEIGGFDENFFLYFEEFDLCRRVKNKGYSLFILANTKVKHIWGASTKRSELNTMTIFQKSRFYYFKKYYGIFWALVIELVTRISKTTFILINLLFIGGALRFYNIDTYITFIGDQAWYYLSARDLVVNGDVPLVGIPSSRPWLHQGAYWTYLLAIGMKILGFHPLSGVYITISFGLVTILLAYYVGKLFSTRTGIIFSILVSTSPYFILNDRFAYHTSPIPFFVLALFYITSKWFSGRIWYFPLIFVVLGILYNFEIATLVLWFPVVILLIILWFRKKNLLKKTINKKILSQSLMGFILTMLPVLIYDTTHGFTQTGKLLLWIPYRVFSMINADSEHVASISKLNEMGAFFIENFTQVLFAQSSLISITVLIAALFWLYRRTKKLNEIHYFLVLLFTTVPVIIVFFNQTPSDAYIGTLSPMILLLIVLFLDSLINFIKPKYIIWIVIISASLLNVFHLLKSNYYFEEGKLHRLTFHDRVLAAKKIIKLASEEKYNIIGKGPGSEFESFTMNHEYLTWLLHNPPSKMKEKLTIIIHEENDTIFIKKLK